MKPIKYVKEAADDFLAEKWREILPATLIYDAVILLMLAAVVFVILSRPGIVGFFPETYSEMIEQSIGLMFTDSLIIILLFLVVSFIISGVQTGMSSFLMNVADGEKPKISSLFAHFKKNCIKNYTVTLMVATNMCACFIVGFLGYILLRCVAYQTITAIWVVAVDLFIIPGLIWGLHVARKHSMLYFILADTPELGIRDTIKHSKDLMRDHKNDRLYTVSLGDVYMAGFFVLYAFIGILCYFFGSIMAIPLIAVIVINIIIVSIHSNSANTVLYRTLVATEAESDQISEENKEIVGE